MEPTAGNKDITTRINGESTYRQGGGGKHPSQTVEHRYDVSWAPNSICQQWEIALGEGLGYTATEVLPATLEAVEDRHGGVCEYCAMPARHTGEETDS